MKRTLLSFICLCMMTLSEAQIARWLIQPSYDDIHMVNGIDAILTDSADYKILWSFQGKRLTMTADDIFDFKDKRAVTTKTGTPYITSIIKDNGETIKFNNCNATHAYPYYSCGKLLVQEGMYNRFITQDGTFGTMKYTKAYPFFNGYATCQAFANVEKLKDPYNALINTNEEIIQFSYNGKIFNHNDVDFISSVNDENIAVVVIKHKLYIFNGNDQSLSPVLPSDTDNNLKNQAKLEGDWNQCFQKKEQTFVLNAKCGKNDYVTFEFDKLLKPLSVNINNVEKVYNVYSEKKKEFTSPLKMRAEGDMYGIYWESTQMLPPQFDKLLTCFDNKVFVKYKGKYGLLEINKDADFSLKINKGNDIAFLHQKYETTVRVDMPNYINADNTFLEFFPDCGIELDKTSRVKKNTESGNFVEYNCILTIPENLPDEIQEVTYPVQVLYNELKSPIINHKVNAWFYKKFEVEEDESQRSVEQGTLTFVFNVKNAQLDGTIVKFDVRVLADTLEVQREDKMSETRYKYKVRGLNEGINNVTVQVLEQGCPPASFPFEVEYHKPVAKTKSKPAEKEKVVIIKKTKSQQQQKPSPVIPRLEI